MLAAFHSIGLQYGPGYRTLVQVWVGASEAVSRLRARSTHAQAKRGTKTRNLELIR